MIRRLLPHPALSVLLVAFWMLLLNAPSWGGLVVGVVLGVLIPLATSRYWPGRPKVRFGSDLAVYGLVMVWDIITANIAVAGLILFRRSADLRSRWLVLPLDLRSPEAVTVLAATISLTPGTVSCDVSACGRVLLIHALDVEDEAAEVARIKRRYEDRLKRIFPA